ncbi:MAG: hypothetical protein ABGZ17_04350 [Planctomycetaceae bacterium]
MAEHLELKQLLITVARSFLQYADEACLWSSSAAPHLAKLAAGQRQDVVRIVTHLQQFAPGVEFGTYPTSYTDLHFISLEFLVHQLVRNQTGLVNQIEGLLGAAIEDASESSLLADMLSNEREILDGIKQLAAADHQTTSAGQNG